MNTQDTLEQIRGRLAGISDLYNRLLLIVGTSGSGKTAALQALGKAEGVEVVQIGTEVSRRLLEVTERQRVLQLPAILEETVAGPRTSRFRSTAPTAPTATDSPGYRALGNPFCILSNVVKPSVLIIRGCSSVSSLRPPRNIDQLLDRSVGNEIEHLMAYFTSPRH